MMLPDILVMSASACMEMADIPRDTPSLRMRGESDMRNRRERRHSRSGFTLVEIMIVVAIISLLAVLAIPSFLKARRRARATKIANDLRIFADGFIQYNLERGAYPEDTHNTLPDGMEDYIKQEDWDADALGGHYNWEGPSWGEGGSYPYAGIALFETTADLDQLTEVDIIMDDGDLSTGNFRLTSNGRYTYIFEEL